MYFDLMHKLTAPSYTVACSGGADSVFAAAFLRAWKPSLKLTLAHFQHGELEGPGALAATRNLAQMIGAEVALGRYDPSGARGSESLEMNWREQRYAFLHGFEGFVITAHTLDDCAETYLMSAMHGTPKLIPATRGNVIRPFLKCRRSDIRDWLWSRGVSWYSDPTNDDVTFTARNRIRANILPEVLQINPGFLTMIRHLIEKAS